jgi:hypothetical protein
MNSCRGRADSSDDDAPQPARSPRSASSRIFAKLPKKSKEDLKPHEYDFSQKSQEVKDWELRGFPKVMPHLMDAYPDAGIKMMDPEDMSQRDVKYYNDYAPMIREHEAERYRRHVARMAQQRQAAIERIQMQGRERAGLPELVKAQQEANESARREVAHQKSIARIGTDEDDAQARNKQRAENNPVYANEYRASRSRRKLGHVAEGTSSRTGSRRGKQSLKSSKSAEAMPTSSSHRDNDIGRAR